MPLLTKSLTAASVAILALSLPPAASAQQSDMRARYERAALVQASYVDHWLLNQQVSPHWIDDARFWFERETRTGHDYAVVDATARRVTDLLNLATLAKGLRAGVPDSVKIDANDLPLKNIRVSLNPATVSFSAFSKEWRYAVAEERLEPGVKAADSGLVVSPDGTQGIFFKGPNLWVRNMASAKESVLTTDGEQFYAYAMPPAAQVALAPAARPYVIWSPDSKRILTAQIDDRQVREMPMITFAPTDGVRPVAWSVREALPGDPHVPEFRMLAIDVGTKKQVEAHYQPIPATRMNDTPMNGNRAWWSADGRRAYFVEIERGERKVNVIEFDTNSGATRVVFSETSPTYIDLGSLVYGPTSLVPLPETNQLVWYSERSGWAHLYLYDLADGRMVRQLTKGDWLVRDVVGIDRKRRSLFITIAGRTAGKDPYYREVAKVGIDDGSFTVLSLSDADHSLPRQPDFGLRVQTTLGERPASSLSPSGDYYVETIQRPDRPTQTLLRDRDGKEIVTVQALDSSGMPKWWRWPEPVQLKAADGTTDLSGVVFRPSDFSPNKKYPIVDHIYGGPQVSNVPEAFSDRPYNQAATIAEAGFVVVVIDGRGTSERSKTFHDASYGAAQTASNVEDHIAGIRQLAKRYPYMDTTRVGIYGFSGGGYMTASAMLRFPNFFKVGVAGSGNHDQRLFWHAWGERYQGLLDGDNYLNQANVTYAKNLKGKLLFIHGLMDHGVHAAGTFQLTQALMNENKDFDMVLLPRVGHDLSGYGLRKVLDYFVMHLAGMEPPADFKLKTGSELEAERRSAIARP